MMLTIHGLPVMVKYHDLKALIKQECKMNDFILDNLVTDVDGYKKVRIGVADESEGAHLTKCLNGFRMGGNVLRVLPIAKGPNQPNNYEQPGGFMPRNDAPNISGNFGNQPMSLMGNRTASWGPGNTNPSNQWSVNQQLSAQILQTNFGFQQTSSTQPFSQQQQSGLPQRPSTANKPFNQGGPFNPMVQNRQGPDKGFGFGGNPNNPPGQAQGSRRLERGHVLRNVELVPDTQRPQQINRFQQENVEQNKPVTINKDYFQGANQFNDPPQNYPQGGQQGSWNKQLNQQQKAPHFDDRIGDTRLLSRKSPGRHSSPPPKRLSPPRRLGSPPPKRMSPSRRLGSPPPKRMSPPRRLGSPPPKRMSPPRRLESPGRRFSPSRRHPEKGYSEGQSKPIRPAYEPDGKTPSQAMYSGEYRQNVHDSQYPGPGGRQMEQRESPWQQDRDKNMYPGQMKKPDDDRRDARMPVSRGPEARETNRPSPMHKSRSPSRRDARERSPVRDRYKRHSPSPRSPRRSWALEKRRSPDINQAPPPPMWPGQNTEEQYGRDKAEGSKHVPVWDHRTLAETEEAMRRESRGYAEDRMRREPNLREPSPRRQGFKPPEERFSPKPGRDSKFETRDPKFESRDPKFGPRDPKFEPRDPKFDTRDPKFDPRDPKFDHRDSKYDSRDPKFEPRGANFESREPKYERGGPKFETRDPKFEPRVSKFDQRDLKFESRDPKIDQRDPKFEPRDSKYNRDGPIFEPRDHKYGGEPKFEPRDKYDRGEPKFEPRDPKYDRGEPKFEPREPKYDRGEPKFEPRDPKYDHRDLKYESRDPKFESRDHKLGLRDHKFETRDPPKFEPRVSKFEPREYEPRDRHKMVPTNQANFDTRGPRFEPRDPKFDTHVTNFEPRDAKFGSRGPIYDPRADRFESRNDKSELRDRKFYPHGPPSFEQHEKYDPRGPKFEPRDPEFSQHQPKFEARDTNLEPRIPKFEPRDPKYESRESKFKSTFEPVESLFKERESDPRDEKYIPRDHKFEGRDRKFEGREDYKDRHEMRVNDDPLDVNFREHRRPDDRHYRDEFLPRRDDFRREDRKESRQSHDEFEKEFEDIYKRTVEFKQKVRELRRSDRDREHSREDRRRESERDDDRCKPAESDHRHSPRDIEPRPRREERSRSPHYNEARKRYDDEKVKNSDSKKPFVGRLAPEIQEKHVKAVASIAEKMMEKYGNFEMNSYTKYRVKEDLQTEISRILHKMFGTKEVSFIEMVVKFNSKHDERAEQKIFDGVMDGFPIPQYKDMKRSAQDSDRSAIPAKTSKRSPDHDVHLKTDVAITENQIQMPGWNFALGQPGFVPNVTLAQYENHPPVTLPIHPNPMMVPSPFSSQPSQVVQADHEDGYNLYLCKDDFKPFTEIQAQFLKQFLVTQIFKETETSNGWAPEFTLKGLQSMVRYEMHTHDLESRNWLQNFDFSEFQLFSVLVYTKEELWYERAAIWLPGQSRYRHIEPLDKLKLQNKKLEDLNIGKWKLVKKIVNLKGTRIYVDMPPSSARALEKHKMMLSYELQKVNVFLKAVAVDKDAFDAGLQEYSITDVGLITEAANSFPIPSLKEDPKIVKVSLKGSKTLSIEQIRKIKDMIVYHLFKYLQQDGQSKTDFVQYGFCSPNSLGILPENPESKRWLCSVDIGRLKGKPIVILGEDVANIRYLKMFLEVPSYHNCNAGMVAERLKQSNQGVKGLNFNLWKPITLSNDKRKKKFEVEVDLESAETISKLKFRLDYMDERQRPDIVLFKSEYSTKRFTELIEKYKAELTDSYDVANMDLASSDDEDNDVICLDEV